MWAPEVRHHGTGRCARRWRLHQKEIQSTKHRKACRRLHLEKGVFFFRRSCLLLERALVGAFVFFLSLSMYIFALRVTNMEVDVFWDDHVPLSTCVAIPLPLGVRRS